MELIEITREEVINNCEKYFENEQQFFLKIKFEKGLRGAYLYRLEEWNSDLEQIEYSYLFEYCDGERDFLEEENIQTIYIIK